MIQMISRRITALTSRKKHMENSIDFLLRGFLVAYIVNWQKVEVNTNRSQTDGAIVFLVPRKLISVFYE